MQEPLTRRQATILSPLRYPGGKRRLVSFVKEALRLNGLRPDLYVEPFAGGASVALQLLNDGAVERIGLWERDPLVAAFWRVAFWDSEWLIKEMQSWKPTVALWERMRAYRPRSDRGKARKCLFLNRTSFSGILCSTAGPIGGRGQTSAYPIDCRFPKERLAKRLGQVARLSSRVAFVGEGDWARCTDRLDQLVETREVRREDVLVYLDPPFYHKANRLYRFCFDHDEHVRLRDALRTIPYPYLLSYDAAPEVEKLYANWNKQIGRVEVAILSGQCGRAETI